jgi:hypothetical protein
VHLGYVWSIPHVDCCKIVAQLSILVEHVANVTSLLSLFKINWYSAVSVRRLGDDGEVKNILIDCGKHFWPCAIGMWSRARERLL